MGPVAHALPADLTGKTVLDIGCNGGFYAIAMKRRGAARVVAIDSDEDYLAQARFAAEVLEQDIEFHRLDVYDVGALGERFDLVLFMGVLYHLRHPLLALDLIREHVAGERMVFQALQRGVAGGERPAEDYPFSETGVFDRPDWPKLHFVEQRYAQDPTNWWIPERALRGSHAAQRRLRDRDPARTRSLRLPGGPPPRRRCPVYPARGRT